MIVKIHKTKDGRKLIAVCDKGLIGKQFEEEGAFLDLSSDFYKGVLMDEEKLEKEVKGAYTISIAGKDSVNFFLDKKMISKENIIYIEKIPYAQCMMDI